MISYLLVVEQHRTQIVIHALLKCQQENLYHEQKDRKSGSAGMPRPISYAVFCLKKKIGIVEPPENLRDHRLLVLREGLGDSHVSDVPVVVYVEAKGMVDMVG